VSPVLPRAGCGTRRLLRLGVGPAVGQDGGGPGTHRADPRGSCSQPWHLRRPTSPRRAAPRARRAGRSQAGGQADAHGWHRGRPPAPSAGLTRRDPAATPAPDLVGRQFTPPAPDRLWVADITQQRTDQGWLYVAVVLDCFSRRIVGWSMADHLRTELVLDALEMAISQRQPAPGLVHHADHGCQYTSLAFGRRLREAGLVASMGTWVTRWTTPWPRACSPPWNASCWTATPGPPEPGCARRCSTTSRSSTTVNAATRPSTTSHPSATRSSTHQQHLLHSHRVHESGATPNGMQGVRGSNPLSSTTTTRGNGATPARIEGAYPSKPPAREPAAVLECRHQGI
jgi:hypothetical protein